MVKLLTDINCSGQLNFIAGSEFYSKTVIASLTIAALNDGDFVALRVERLGAIKRDFCCFHGFLAAPPRALTALISDLSLEIRFLDVCNG